MKRSPIATLVILCATVFLLAADSSDIVQIPLTEYDHRHFPSFEANERYELAQDSLETTIDVTCKDDFWFAEITIDSRRYPRTKYSPLYGFGGGGPWQVYWRDVNQKGIRQIVAALYNGGYSGGNADLINVIFFTQVEDEIEVMQYWTHGFEKDKIPDYYKKAQPIEEVYAEED